MPEEQNTSWLLRFRQAGRTRQKLLRERRRERRKRYEELGPLVIRYCPQRLRPVVEVALLFVGMFAVTVLACVCLTGLLIGPFVVARIQNETPVVIFMRWYVHWFRGHFSKENFEGAYILIQIIIAYTLIYFSKVAGWVMKRLEKKRLERVEREVSD